MSKMLTVSKVNFKKDDSKHIIKGPVYVPMLEDTQGDFMTADEIEKMAYGFMKAMNIHNIDKQHDYEGDQGYVCESYLAQKSDPDDYIEGTWVVAIKVVDDETWDQIEKGEITGLSMAGFAQNAINHDSVEGLSKACGTKKKKV